ncbi:hypothetical protein [Silvimonas amylolytica]|uniref:hypothetical protein n=1 Tax=Silvimonas amylolytica TaxID=449663 RepID=UPI001666A9CF|nr:hypothetical protein [Silvimonas amylolytica]
MSMTVGSSLPPTARPAASSHPAATQPQRTETAPAASAAPTTAAAPAGSNSSVNVRV